MHFKPTRGLASARVSALAMTDCGSCYTRSVDTIPFPYSEPTRPLAASERRHGPSGYTDYTSYKPWLRDEHDFRCVYCLARETWAINATSSASGFGVDHMRSRRDAPEDETKYGNLCYCCNDCNSAKGPCSIPQRLIEEPLSDHLVVHQDGTVKALTPEGQWLCDCVYLNHAYAVERRRLILELRQAAMNDLAAGIDSQKLTLFEYPSRLEDLHNFRPPQNVRPSGVEGAAWARRLRGELPRFY